MTPNGASTDEDGPKEERAAEGGETASGETPPSQAASAEAASQTPAVPEAPAEESESASAEESAASDAKAKDDEAKDDESKEAKAPPEPDIEASAAEQPSAEPPESEEPESGAPSSASLAAFDDALTPRDVVAFWREAGAKRWFAKDEGFDRDIRDRFEALHHSAARGELDDWSEDPVGALALLLLLDQFPRNLYRGSAHAFATDPLARQVAGRAVEQGFDREAPEDLRVFFYLPFEHSEDARDQAMSVFLIGATGEDSLVHWAQLHADIIERFGRFPHRNAALGRVSTDAELRFLAEGGFHG